MIVEAIVNVFAAIVSGLLGLLPAWSLPDVSGMVDSISGGQLFHYAGWINQYVPLAEALTLIAAWMVVRVGVFAFQSIVWLLSKAHVLGGGSS